MAQQMIEQWELAVLRVRLDLSERTPAVVTDLLAYPHGIENVVWSERYPMDAFGLPHGSMRTLPDLDLRVPDALRDSVVQALHAPIFGGKAALWLHLIPPHGYLGAIPWEHVLVPAMSVPLLRVPDRLPVASDPGRTWTVAMVLNAGQDATWPGTVIPALLSELDSRVHSKVEVHVFADARSASEITGAMAGRSLWGTLEIHDPYSARGMSDDWHRAKMMRSAEPTRARRMTGPAEGEAWAAWIAASLRGRAVRALHVVSAAELDGERPLLAVSRDPALPLETMSTAYWNGDDVLGLATAVGAALLSFGSPPDNPSDVATRMLADGVGVRRAGPTIYTSMALDPTGEALASAQAFVANEPGSTPVPAHPGLFAYLQPESVRAEMTQDWPGGYYADSPSAPAAEVQQVYANSDVLPGWVATSERYIDANVTELVQTARPAGAAPNTKQAYDSGKQRALSQLREIVDRHLRDK